jgi:ElaB/YqjD/DUF883 family membrane-anchored ribosome-binding protein
MVQSPATYAEIAKETMNLIVDEIGASNRRNVEFVKSLWELARPSERTNASETVRDGFQRAESAVSLTVRELETSLNSGIELAEKLLGQSKKLQQQSFESAREFADKALSNVKQAVEATGDRIEGLSKKLEESKKAA